LTNREKGDMTLYHAGSH